MPISWSRPFGILPRAEVAEDVKSLDQDARGLLRKHGVRFGQFNIFMPLLLKPAPTRLRLVLWSLSQGLDEFPEAPPPGLVTVPAMAGARTDTVAGYRNAGERAVRIDMLERLADMLRSEDSRGGFEANADMLSITGLSLEQFAELLRGLGYKAEQGKRAKVKAPAPKAEAPSEEASETAPAEAEDAAAEGAPEGAEPETAAPEAAEVEAKPDAAATPEAGTDTAEAAPEAGTDTAEAAPEAGTDTAEVAPEAGTAEAAPEAETEATGGAPAEPEMEVFYTFTWGGNRQQNRGRGEPRGKGARPQGKSDQGRPQGKGKGKGKPKGKGQPRDQGGQKFSAKPPRKEKAIDPDNPFAAALMGLKDDK